MGQRANGGRPEVSLGRRFLSLPTLISFSLAGVLGLFLLTRFEVDLAATWESIRQANALLYLLAFPVHYLTFLFRGARWRVLLRNTTEATRPVPSSLYCGRLILLGWFANSVTWFRLGDAYRAYAYTEDSGASFFRTMGTVVAERVVDLVLVLVLLLVAALALSFSAEEGLPLAILAAASGMVAVAALGLMAMKLFGRRLVGFLPGSVEAAYRRFHHGTMGSFRQVPFVALLGLLGWLAEVARLYLVVQALGFEVGLGMVLFITLASAFLTLIPLTPGGLGIVETGITGLLALTLVREDAIAVALLDRSISYVSIIVLGGALFVLRHVLRARHRQAVAQTRSGVP